MEYLSLIFLHVAFGILWAGGGIVLGLFIVPSVMDAGPAGGAVMAGVVKRRMSIVLSGAAVIVVLTGLRLYMIRFTTAWLGTAEGLAIAAGAVLGIGAFVLGVLSSDHWWVAWEHWPPASRPPARRRARNRRRNSRRCVHGCAESPR